MLYLVNVEQIITDVYKERDLNSLFFNKAQFFMNWSCFVCEILISNATSNYCSEIIIVEYNISSNREV